MRKMGLLIAGALAVTAYGVVAAIEPPKPPAPPADRFHQDQSNADDGESSRVVSFNDDIRPILASNCLVCHGFDPSTRKAKLRLDTRAGATALRAGEAPIVPGDPFMSLMIERISDDDPEFRMPPGERTPLKPSEIELIRRWIAQGAPYDVHWSFKPIADARPPVVNDQTWARDDVDRFVLAKLEANDLAPAAGADKRTLIRRAYLDVIGLPPTPEAVQRFVDDDSPDAFEVVVDELLASPHFGERWGRHWLDLMRYAETHGHEFDYPIRNAWQYRDYVIRAFNADVPYDDFVREHLAGDLLPEPRRHPVDDYNESLLGTGWWWLSQGTHAPVDVRSDEAERIDNQIDVLSKSFLGLTVSCARCHDHKFDPITQRDFYALQGFVQSSRRQEAYLDPRREIESGVQRLEALCEQVDRLVHEQFQSASVDRAAKQLLAACAIIEDKPGVPGGPGPEHADDEPPYVIFDDFESGAYDTWTVEGTSFGDRPYTQGELHDRQNGVTPHGNGFVNTHQSRNGEASRASDEQVGTMLSEPFTIEHRFVHFLIGGGRHKDQTCINLLVDDAMVRTAVGRNRNELRPWKWDVGDLMGKTARFQIVDNHRGGWGHIVIDRLAFADEERLLPASRRRIEAVAKAFDVDHLALVRSVDAIRDDVFDSLTSSSSSSTPAPDKADDQHIVFETFDDASYAAWFRSGEAFGDRPSMAGDRVGPTRMFAPPGAAHSGLIAPKLEGTIRSQTFELTKPYVQYRLKGRGGRIRLIIDGYFLDEFNPLLFDGIKIEVNTEETIGWRWHSQRIIDKYIGHRAYIEIIDDGDGFVAVDAIRFSDSTEPPEVGEEASERAPSDEALRDRLDRLMAEIPAAVQGVADRTSSQRQVQIVNWLTAYDLIDLPDAGEVDALLMQASLLADSLPAPMRAMAITDGTPEDDYLFIRGDHRQAGEVVPRRFIEVLGGEPNSAASGSGRLALAERLLNDVNPLPARVMVNRIWQHLYGAALVPTPDDFGGLGQAPTHPELLDHLAHWFRTEGEWSVKALIRRLMLTSAYRMSSAAVDAHAEEADPTNRLFHRMNVKRLEGEIIRDSMLAISGRLDPKMFGAPIDVHLTPFMQGRGRPRKSGPIDGAGRRTIYLAVRRNFLSPMLLAFDTPVPHSTMGRRTVSNVPAQSLILMNDPLAVEQAKLWAARVLADAGASARDRVNRLYLEAFGRPAKDRELEAAMAYMQSQAEARGMAPEAWRSDAALWADLCHVLFNVKEFVFVN